VTSEGVASYLTENAWSERKTAPFGLYGGGAKGEAKIAGQKKAAF
jgi:hypothetical protein